MSVIQVHFPGYPPASQVVHPSVVDKLVVIQSTVVFYCRLIANVNLFSCMMACGAIRTYWFPAAVRRLGSSFININTLNLYFTFSD